MGFFLPSETARLVLSYLLDHKFNQSREQFMGECPHVQELKCLSVDQLCHHSKINGRSLMDILREYNGLITGITKLASEVSQDQFENLQFEPPLRVLKTLGQILQSNSASKKPPAEKKTASSQTTPCSTQTPAKVGKTITTQTDPSTSPARTRKNVCKAVITQNGSCQTNLNLINFSPPIPKIIQSKEVQTDTPVSTVSSVQTDNIEVSSEPTEDSLFQNYSPPEESVAQVTPLTLNFDELGDEQRPTSTSQSVVSSRSVSPPKTDMPFFHSNIRVFPRQGYIPILPKPGTEPAAPPPPPRNHQKKWRDRKKQEKLNNRSNQVSDTPVSENNFQNRLLSGENSHSTPSQAVKEKEPSKEKDSRKNKPKKNKDSDEEFLNELLGIGDQIASIIPKNLSTQNISDIADKGLDNPGLIENLINVLEGLGDESEDDSRVNTPVTSPLPDLDTRENVSTEIYEQDNSGENRENVIEEDCSKGFDAELSVSTVESAEPLNSVPNTNIDTLAMIVNDTINTVTEPYISPSKPKQVPHKTTKTRKRKNSPKHKNDAKKTKQLNSPTQTELSSVASTDKQAVPQLGLNTFRLQFKSVLSKSFDCAPKDAVPVIADNPILTRLAQMTRQTFDNNLEYIEVKEEEDTDLNREVSEAILEESEVKEEEIHITDILPDTMDIGTVDVVNEQLVKQMFPVTAKRDRRKGPRCKQCEGCTRADCGQCKNCKDKIKFGGDGHLKQACALRICENLGQPTTQVLAEISVENISVESNSNDKENDPLESTTLSADIDTFQHPVHVRNLIFSPPKSKDDPKSPSPKKSRNPTTPEKCHIKTLSPCKSSSPIRRTNSAWNKDVKNMFSPSNPKAGSTTGSKSKDGTTKTTADSTSNKPTENNISDPPSQASNIKSSIPFTESVVRSMKTPITVSKQIRIPIHMPIPSAKVVPVSPSSIPLGAIVKPLPPGFKSAGFTAIISDQLSSLETSKEPFLWEKGSKEKIVAAPEVETVEDEGSAVAGPSNFPLASSALKAPNTMPIIEPGESSPLKSKMLPPPTPMSNKKSPNSKSKASPVPSWDEKLRAVLGEAEKDMSHISHRLQEKEKRGRRRSPRKRRQVDKPESDEEFSDPDSHPEIDFGESNITPEAQKILDTFANKLLEQLEENVAKNIVVPPGQSSKEQKLFGKSDDKGKKKDGKNCICCRMEKVVDRRKHVTTVFDDLSKKSETEAVCTNSEKSEDKAKEKEASSENEPNLIPLSSHTTDSAPNEDQGESQSKVSSGSIPEITTPTFKTPKKADNFVFKTPVKASLTTPQKASLLSPQTPRSRHIPASPLHQSSSPRGSRLAIPLTPSRRSPSQTPGRTRHASSLDTPVLNTPNPDMAAPSLPFTTPITPKCKNSPCPSYYTPSPSPSSQRSVPSPLLTPGLRFLQEEGERLSQSDDSMSPTKAEQSAKRKTFRNLFKKSTAGRDLGSLLEQKISNYPFSTSSHTPLTPFMSPAGQSSYDYTSSPQIVMGRPSPSEDENHASFVSPNRTCYLSPTGMALSSTVLGFHQSPAHTDSDNTDLEGDDLEKLTQSEPSIYKSKSAVNVTLEAADDTAVQDPEETIEAIQAHLAQACTGTIIHSLSDESNTASIPHIALSKQDDIPADILDRVSPEFPDLHLSDDSEEESIEVSEVDSSTERKVTKLVKVGSFVESFLEVKSNEAKEDCTSKTYTPRKPRRIAFTSTARRSPLKNDSTNFEMQYDANNLDKKLNEEAGHLLETDGLGAEAGIDLGLETRPPSDKKESRTTSSRKSPRKRKNIKSPKVKTPTTYSEASFSAASDKTPPSKRQRMPEQAEFHEGKELSLMFSPQKQRGKSLPPGNSKTNTNTDSKHQYDLTSTNIHPSQLPSVSVNIEKISLPATIMAPDSPTKSISLPPTPDSPARSIVRPSRSPTPTICKALGLQRSGSKPKPAKDPSWVEAVWGLGKHSEKSKVDNVNSVIGVGDGQVDGHDKIGRRGSKEVKSEDEEWTPERHRSKSKSRVESNERMSATKKTDKDVDPILLQLRMNKPKTGSRNRSKSVEKSKHNKSKVRSRSRSRNRTDRKSKELDNQNNSKPQDKIRARSDKSSSEESGKFDTKKSHSSSNKGPIRRNEDLFSPKRTRSRDKMEKEGLSDDSKSKSMASKEQKSGMPRSNRTSSRDKIKTSVEGIKGIANLKDTSESNSQGPTTLTVQCSPKKTRSRSGNIDPKIDLEKNATEKKKESKLQTTKAVQNKVGKSQTENKECKKDTEQKGHSKHNDNTIGTSASSPVKKKGEKTVPNILKKSPQKSKTSESIPAKETELNIIEELKAAEMRDTRSNIQPKEPSYVVTNNKRCRQCAGCTRLDCGQCRYCKDKVKFGGDGHLKQACALKICENSQDPSKGSPKNNKLKKIPKKVEVTLDDDTEVITSGPLDIDLLAEKSAEILSSLSRLGTTESAGEEVQHSSILEQHSSSEPSSEATPIISRSSFFVFQKTLPFGVFEEDLH